tara:strand:+ start:69 stop:383 length:315 start_codon:yes stop_codon:yes gene_type:complete
MQTYYILDAENGNVTNTIVADEAFIQANFDFYEQCVAVVSEQDKLAITEADERQWRDAELSASDFIVPLSDHPQRAAYMAYRESLRSWPADAENFPDTRPVLGE